MSQVFQFTVDVVVGSIITSAAQRVIPVPVVDVPGLTSPAYLLYPIADHIADKVCATFEQHPGGRPSSRVRDLVDLVIIARTQTVDASELWLALEAERLNRNLPPIVGYATPVGWRSTYSGLAATVAECAEHRTYERAVALVGTFLDPVLKRAVRTGRWKPESRTWS